MKHYFYNSLLPYLHFSHQPNSWENDNKIPNLSIDSIFPPTRSDSDSLVGDDIIHKYSKSLSIQSCFPSVKSSSESDQPHFDPTSSNTRALSSSSHNNREIQSKQGSTPSLADDKPGDDGDNRRKYGQKQVEGSEYPRSYYKCAHLNCPVKKEVQRSPNGEITEIYRGEHNHERPHPNRHAKEGSDLNGNINSQAKPEQGSQAGNWNKSSETVPAYSMPEKDQESTQAVLLQLPGSSDNEDEGDVEMREEPNPKRRITDVGTSEVPLPHMAVTEPKIILQTSSEVDLLDDGYRWRKCGQNPYRRRKTSQSVSIDTPTLVDDGHVWRKYGQKEILNAKHPRHYYRCIHRNVQGCRATKQVQKTEDGPPKYQTTYRGHHTCKNSPNNPLAEASSSAT